MLKRPYVLQRPMASMRRNAETIATTNGVFHRRPSRLSAGGMYPVKTTSKPFQILHRFDPMTYGVNGLRQLILGGIDARLWQAIIVLFAISAVALAISCLSARRDQLWNLNRLIPAIKM